ncbi:hypothetical protein MYX06_01580 [Patescibacteria group bacterium AH-259-L05]|nr:hypothetical protein [Patescibacteria group bacterium AH-259-L05]
MKGEVMGEKINFTVPVGFNLEVTLERSGSRIVVKGLETKIGLSFSDTKTVREITETIQQFFGKHCARSLTQHLLETL